MSEPAKTSTTQSLPRQTAASTAAIQVSPAQAPTLAAATKLVGTKTIVWQRPINEIQSLLLTH
jgi:hypothetical protein